MRENRYSQYNILPQNTKIRRGENSWIWSMMGFTFSERYLKFNYSFLFFPHFHYWCALKDAKPPFKTWLQIYYPEDLILPDICLISIYFYLCAKNYSSMITQSIDESFMNICWMRNYSSLIFLHLLLLQHFTTKKLRGTSWFF